MNCRIFQLFFLMLFPCSILLAQEEEDMKTTEVADSDYIPLTVTVKLDHAELKKMSGNKDNHTSYSASYIDSLIKMVYGQQNVLPTNPASNTEPALVSTDNNKQKKVDPVYKIVVPSKEKLSVSERQLKFKTANPIKVEKTDSGYSYVIAENKSLHDAESTMAISGVKKSELVASIGKNNIVIDTNIISNAKIVSNRTKKIKMQKESLTSTGKLKKSGSSFETQSVLNISNDSTIKYNVQIAACRKPLSKRFLRYIYNGPEKIKEFYEDGWYKYRIEAGMSYNEAQEKKYKTKVHKAFIVALLNNSKVDINVAIQKTDTRK